MTCVEERPRKPRRVQRTPRYSRVIWDDDHVDRWVVNVVVMERIHVPDLNLAERILVTQRLRRLGVQPGEISELIGMDDRVVLRYSNAEVPEHMFEYDYTRA